MSLTRCSPSSDVRCRIEWERVPTSRNSIANQIGKFQASSPRCSLYARGAAPIQEYLSPKKLDQYQLKK